MVLGLMPSLDIVVAVLELGLVVGLVILVLRLVVGFFLAGFGLRRLETAQHVLLQHDEGRPDTGLQRDAVAVDVDDVPDQATGGDDLVPDVELVGLLAGRLGLALLGTVDEEVEGSGDDRRRSAGWGCRYCSMTSPARWRPAWRQGVHRHQGRDGGELAAPTGVRH